MTSHRSMSVRSFLLSLAVVSATSAFHLQSSVRSQAQASGSHSTSLSSTSSVNLRPGGGVRSGVKGAISTVKTGVHHSLSEAHALFEQGSASSTSSHGFSASEAAEATFPRSNLSGSAKYSISLPKPSRIALHTDNTPFGTNEHNISGTTHNSFLSAVATNNSEMSISNVEFSKGQGYYVTGGGHVSQGSQSATATASDPGQSTGISGISSSGFTRGSISRVSSHGSDRRVGIAGEENTSHLNTAKTGVVSSVWGDMSGYSSHSAGNAWQPQGIESTISGVHGTYYGNRQGISSNHGHQEHSTGVPTSSETANLGHTSGTRGTYTEFDGQGVSFSKHHDVSFGGVHNNPAGGKAGISTVANLDLSGGVDGSFTKSARNEFSVVKSYDVPFGAVQNIYAQKEASISTVSSSGRCVGYRKTVPDFNGHDNSNAFGEEFNAHEYEHRENVSPSINIGDSFSGSGQSGISVTKIVGHSLSNSEREEASAFGSDTQSTLFTNPGSLSASSDSTKLNADNQRHYGHHYEAHNAPVFAEHNGHFVPRNHGILGQMGVGNQNLTNYDYSANYSRGFLASNFSVGGNDNHSYFGTSKYNDASSSGSGTLVPERSSDRDTRLETARTPTYPATQTYRYTYGIYTSTGGRNRALSGFGTDNPSETGSDTYSNATNVDLVGGGIGGENFHSSPIDNEELTELGNKGFSGTEHHRLTALKNQRPTGSGSVNLVSHKHQDLNELGNVRGSVFGNMRTLGLSGIQTHEISSHVAKIDANSMVNNTDMPDAEPDNYEGAINNGSSYIETQVVSGFQNQGFTNSQIHDQTSPFTNHNSEVTINRGLTATDASLNGGESYGRRDYVSTSLTGTENHGQPRAEHHNPLRTEGHIQRGHGSHGLNGDGVYRLRVYGSNSLTSNVNHGLTGDGNHALTSNGSPGPRGDESHGLTGHGSLRGVGSHSLTGDVSHGLTSDGSHGLTGHGSNGLTSDGSHGLTGHGSLTGVGSHSLRDDGSHGLTSDGNHGLTGHGSLTGVGSHSLTGHGSHGLTSDGSHGLTGHGSHSLTGHGSNGLTSDGSHGLTEHGSLRGVGSHSLTGDGSHGLTSDGSHGLTGHRSHSLTGHGTLTGVGNFGLTDYGSHGLTGHGSLTGDGYHGLTGDGYYELAGAGSQTSSGFERHGLRDAGRHVLTGFGSHDLTGARGHSVTGFRSYTLTGGGSHGATGARIHEQTSDGSHRLPDAGSYGLANSGNNGLLNSASQVLTSVAGQVLTQLESHGLTGNGNHGLDGAGGQTVTGSGDHVLTDSRGISRFESHGSTNANGHGSTGARGFSLTSFKSYNFTGTGSHGLTGAGSHNLTVAAGHSVTGDGGHEPTNDGRHKLIGVGSHDLRTPGHGGFLNAGGQVLEKADLTPTGGHGLRVSGGYGLIGIGGNDQTGFLSRGLTGSRSHGLIGSRGHSQTSVGGHDLADARSHGITGDLNSQRSAGSQYLSTGLSSSHSLKQHSETHGRWESHNSDGGGRTSGSLYNTHSVGGDRETHGHLKTRTSHGSGRTSGSFYNTQSVDGHSDTHGHLETHTSEDGGPVSQSNTGIFVAGGKPTASHGSSPLRVGVKGH